MTAGDLFWSLIPVAKATRTCVRSNHLKCDAGLLQRRSTDEPTVTRTRADTSFNGHCTLTILRGKHRDQGKQLPLYFNGISQSVAFAAYTH